MYNCLHKKQKWRKREACANFQHLSRILPGQYTRSKLYAIQDVTIVQHEVHSFLSKYWNNHSTMIFVCQTKPYLIDLMEIIDYHEKNAKESYIRTDTATKPAVSVTCFTKPVLFAAVLYLLFQDQLQGRFDGLLPDLPAGARKEAVLNTQVTVIRIADKDRTYRIPEFISPGTCQTRD